MRRIAMCMQMFTKHMALAACGCASHWLGYQPKEPKNIFRK